ncbi:LysR family transcriptional regulator [Methylosinus sp. Ce-a6]|uniref:LysR family transcriptional regulator n=1 Tax=Methylosinus sp. Ce-a6 TaxID=2172005 RepID=UPI00135AA782|nr:LysR family transcriptional regulator [Methylosinus sp. Ce-a6]
MSSGRRPAPRNSPRRRASSSSRSRRCWRGNARGRADCCSRGAFHPPLRGESRTAAARCESFQLAAEFGVTPTEISHQIENLGTALGMRLFTRKASEIPLTQGEAADSAFHRRFAERRRPLSHAATRAGGRLFLQPDSRR